MAYTREQARRLFNSGIDEILHQAAKDKQEKREKEADEIQKQQEFWGRLNAIAMVANLGDKARNAIVEQFRDVRYGEDLNVGGDLVPQRKWDWKTKMERDWLPSGFLPGGKKPKLGKVGGAVKDYVLPLEQTKGYKEFKDTAALDDALEGSFAGGDESVYDFDESGAFTASASSSDVYTSTGELLGTPSTTSFDINKLPGAEDIVVSDVDVADIDVDVADVDVADVDVPPEPGGSKFIGKAFEKGQTALQLANIGNTITSEYATDEQKAIASVQGAKMLTDLATKKAGEKSAEAYIKSKTITDIAGKKTLEEGAKLTGKQVIGAGLGSVLGGYTAVTEGKAAGESWEEEDYDEAILHGMASGSGALQSAGAGMMATGVGAPIGAILYGVGTAGSLISSAGLFLEGLFEKAMEVEVPKPKLNIGKYFDSIRAKRKY